MNSLNLSAWAVKHPAVVLFLILGSAGAGVIAYLGMGRAEDPTFTVKTLAIAMTKGGNVLHLGEALETELKAIQADLPAGLGPSLPVPGTAVPTSRPRIRSQFPPAVKTTPK